MCERCGNVGKHRWIDYLLRFRMNKIGVFLRDKCYKALRQAARARLGLFREYRDIQSRATLRASRKSSMNPRHAAALALVGWVSNDAPWKALWTQNRARTLGLTNRLVSSRQCKGLEMEIPGKGNLMNLRRLLTLCSLITLAGCSPQNPAPDNSAAQKSQPSPATAQPDASILQHDGCTIDLAKVCQAYIDQPQFTYNSEEYDWQRF